MSSTLPFRSKDCNRSSTLWQRCTRRMSWSCTGMITDEWLKRISAILRSGRWCDVAVRSQDVDGGGEGPRAEGREVAQSRQKHCVGYGGTQQLQVLTRTNVEHIGFSGSFTAFSLSKATGHGDGGRVGEDQAVVPDADFHAWEEGPQ